MDTSGQRYEQVDRLVLPCRCQLLIIEDDLHPQVQDLETALKKFCKGYTWRDAPAENAVLFHRRVKQFMQHYICQKSSSGAIRSGLLGRVLHYVIRYEVQMRGSCECICFA
jgi:hypothetical protein